MCEVYEGISVEISMICGGCVGGGKWCRCVGDGDGNANDNVKAMLGDVILACAKPAAEPHIGSDNLTSPSLRLISVRAYISLIR